MNEKKEWKGLQISWTETEKMDIEENQAVCFSEREIGILLSAITPYTWRTRWLDLPENQDLYFMETLSVKLATAGECGVNCDQVQECIESGGGTTTINNITNNYYFGDSTRDLGSNAPLLADCPPDRVFATTTQLVDYLNSQAIDAFEIIEVATNNLELITQWFDDIPLVNVTVGTLLEYVQWIIDAIKENYEAQYTVALRDEYRCDLFCRWIDNCSLSLRDVATYFLFRLNPTVNPLEIMHGISELVLFLVDGQWEGTEICDAMMFAMCGIMSLEEINLPFINIKSVYTFETLVALASNDTDPDWSIVCDPCETTWTHVFDFEISSQTWVNTMPSWIADSGGAKGAYVTAEGWQTEMDNVKPQYYAERLNIYVTAPALFNIIMMTVEYEVIGSVGSWSRAYIRSAMRFSTDSVDRFDLTLFDLAPDENGIGEAQWFGNINPISVNVNLWSAYTTSAANINNDVIVKKVTLRGTGTDPFL